MGLNILLSLPVFAAEYYRVLNNFKFLETNTANADAKHNDPF